MRRRYPARMAEDILAIMERWMEVGEDPFDASEAWAVFWAMGLKTAPGFREKLGFLGAALRGFVRGLIG